MIAGVDPATKAVRLEFTAATPAATVQITRVGPSGTPATVRGYTSATVIPDVVTIARDFEAPIGVPLTYTLTAYDSAGAPTDTQTVAITIASDGCSDTWVNDLARVMNTIHPILESLPELDFPTPATVHDVITRRDPIVSSDVAHTPAFELSFLTATLNDRDRAKALLGNGIPVLLRTPPEDGIGNLYFSVLGYKEQRIVPGATLTDRRFVVTGRQVQRPDPHLYEPFVVSTYQHVSDANADYQELLDSRATYDAVLYDWEGTTASDVVPWPPVDV